MKKIALILLFVILSTSVVILLSGKRYVFKALVYNFAGIDDYHLFQNRIIESSTNPVILPFSKRFGTFKFSDSTTKLLSDLNTTGLVVYQNDSILMEEYHDDYGVSSYSNSFSMAKSITSLLIGIAIDEGLIRNIDQPVGEFLPEFKIDGKENITIRHLLTMSSGLNWDESYINPFSMTTEAYYGYDLEKLISNLKVEEKPGIYFDYKSGDTQILALILKKVTGKNLSQYTSEKLWKPLGMENIALWSLDHDNGVEKAYCCVNSNARDFGKLGLLILKNGKYNQKQIISEHYLKAATTPSLLKDKKTNKICDFYGFQFWIFPRANKESIVYLRGILGQYVIVLPNSNTVITRLGKNRGEKIGDHIKETINLINEFEK